MDRSDRMRKDGKDMGIGNENEQCLAARAKVQRKLEVKPSLIGGQIVGGVSRPCSGRHHVEQGEDHRGCKSIPHGTGPVRRGESHLSGFLSRHSVGQAMRDFPHAIKLVFDQSGASKSDQRCQNQPSLKPPFVAIPQVLPTHP